MFRFTIRDMLWLTVVVALAVGWGITDLRARKSRIEAENSRRLITPMQNTIRVLVNQQRKMNEEKLESKATGSETTPAQPEPAR